MHYLGGGVGKNSQFFGQLDQNDMGTFSFGEVWTVEFTNGGSIVHCGKKWGEAASRSRRSPILGTPQDVYGTFPYMHNKLIMYVSCKVGKIGLF